MLTRLREQVICEHCGLEYDYDQQRHCWTCDGPGCPQCLSHGPQPLCSECGPGRSLIRLEPMLAVNGSMPPQPQDWAFEFKWDGIRALCYWDGARMRLESRNLNDLTYQYPDLVAGKAQIGPLPVILDGEIVAMEEGRPSFARLQQRMHLSASAALKRAALVPVQYYLFDILWRGRRSLLDQPYRKRRKTLEAMKLSHPRWRVPPSRVGEGPAMLDIARQRKLEGIIAKRPASPYRPGERSADWIKIKIVGRQEFVVGGWEPRRNREDQIGSLLVGYYIPRTLKLQFAGRVGTGFSQATHRRLIDLLRRVESDKSPFEVRSGDASARYVTPQLVAEVAYRRWPRGGQLQQAVFVGLRSDKPAREVILDDRS